MTSHRLYFLDNLRAFVIMLVIVLHASMTYMLYAPPWWYVLDTQNSLFFTLLVLLLDVPIMLIMFFIAGYFALPSLQKKGSGVFLRDKFIRIGAPWVFGALFLAPPTAYMTYFSRHVPMGYLEFWRTDFWSKLYQQSVYWFLGVLLAMFCALSLAHHLSRGVRESKPVVARPSWTLFASFGGLMTLGFLTMNLFFPLDQWSHNYLFVYQPVRLPLYIGYFVLGIYASQRGWFTANGYQPRLMPWSVGCLLAGILYLGFRLAMAATLTTVFGKIGVAILFNALCLTALMAGAAVFQRHVNGAGWFWKHQAAASFGIYYVHPLILYPLAYVFVGISLPLFFKAFLLMLLAWLLSWGVSAGVLKKVPIVRDIF